MTENRNERLDKPPTSLPTGRIRYFLQACTLSNSLPIAASFLCLPRSLGEIGGGGRSLLQCSGCTSASHSPWVLATPSTPRAPSPRCLSLPACPRQHPGKFSHDSLPGMSQALPVLYTVSHSSHASTKIKGRGAFLWLPSLATSLKGRRHTLMKN